MDDRELWTAWARGDADAGNRFVERHFLSVYRFFRARVGDYADELTQRTFLACLESLERYDGCSSVRAYILGIARKQLLRHLEGRSRKIKGTEPASETLAQTGPSPSGLIEAQTEGALLLEALERMPTDFRTALELYYWEDMRIAEIADVLQCPEGTVRSRLTRARRLLREELTKLRARPARAMRDEAFGS